MKNGIIKHASLFIILLVLFSTTANAFTLFDDVSPSYGISASDTDDDFGTIDKVLHAEVPVPFCVCLATLPPAIPSHHPKAIIPIEAIPFLNHISRAPPLFVS